MPEIVSKATLHDIFIWENLGLAYERIQLDIFGGGIADDSGGNLVVIQTGALCCRSSRRSATAFKDQISLSAHQKAADYTVAKGKFKRSETLYSMVILLLWTLGGGLAVLYGAWSQLEMGPMLGGILFFLSFLLIGSLLELPYSYYKTFILEDKFGFNRQTPGLFFSDFIKQTVLMLVVGGLLIWVALWMMNSAGDYWWLYLWAAGWALRYL